MREIGPATNNSLEAFNRVIKQVMTDYRKLPFGEYSQAIFEELKRRSEESSSIMQFPKTPFIPRHLILLAQSLSENFNLYFQLYQGEYFIKDRYAVCTIFNPKTSKLKQKIRDLAVKVEKKEPEFTKRFLDFYTKPSLRSIALSLEPNPTGRSHFLSFASIRHLKLHVSHDDEDKTLLLSSCSCNDYFTLRICIHLLALLIKTGNFDISINFKKPKKRGRKPKVGRALQRENDAPNVQ